MNLRQLTTAELGKARDAADYLCRLRAGLDAVLAVKPGTLRAGLTAGIEDRAVDGASAQRAAVSQVT